MFIYLFLLAAVVIESILWIFLKKNKILNFMFSLIPALLLYFIFVFRSVEVGRDTIVYYEKFLNSTSISNISLFSDPAFYFCMFLVRCVTDNFNIFLGIMGLPIFIPLFILVYKKCENPGLGYLIYIFTTLSMTLSALRQTIALGLCIIAYLFYSSKKVNNLFCVFLIVLSVLFHSSSSVFLICIPFLLIKPNSRSLVFITFLAFVFIFMGKSLGGILAQTGISYYGVNSELTNVPELGIFCFLTSSVFLLFYEKSCFYNFFYKMLGKDKGVPLMNNSFSYKIESSELGHCLIIGFLLSFFMLLSSSNNVFPRMSIFFVPFFILSSNSLIFKTSQRIKVVATVVFTLAASLIFLYLFVYSDRLDCVPFKIVGL